MPKYKAILRIPTQEPYAYIELVVEGTPEMILEAYNEFTRLVKPVLGLTERDFQPILDRYLQDNIMTSAEYESLGTEQKSLVQTLKRAFKRLKAKQ